MPRTGDISVSDDRRALRHWLETTGFCAGRPVQIDRLSGDVSPRRYYRLTIDRPLAGMVDSAIAVRYPEEMRDAFERFETTTRLLGDVGVRVPAILQSADDGRWMLVEDLGERTIFDRSVESPSWVRLRLAAAARIPDKIQRIDPRLVADLNPTLGEAALSREIEQTWEVYLEPVAGLKRDRGLGRRLAEALERINRDLGQLPLVPCHRDFMLRNLLALDDGRVAVIDHQDLRLGPAAYDLASLLNDSVSLPEGSIRPILELVLKEEQMPVYQRCVVQRCLKIVGTFHRFAERGEVRYLPMVPGALRRALEALSTLHEVDGLPLSRDLNDSLDTPIRRPL